MAKINVIKMNFTSKVKAMVQNGSALGGLFGNELDDIIGNLPDEQEIWVDTDEIRQIDTMVVEGAFKIHYKGDSTEGKNSVDIKADCLDKLLKAWRGV